VRNLFIMNADGSSQRQVTFNPAEYSQWESWSPQGDWIAYTFKSQKDSRKGQVIYLIHPDGSGQQRLTPPAGSLAIRRQPGRRTAKSCISFPTAPRRWKSG